jgi:hypothetical protein
MDRLSQFFTRHRHADEQSGGASHRLLDEDSPAVKTRPRSSVWWKVYITLLHVLLLLSMGFIWLNLKVTYQSSWSPLRDYIEYEARSVDIAGIRDHKKYGGPPTEEQNKAWDHLMEGAFFNATISEFTRAGESVENLTQLTEGGYLASIGVYHELHCLRKLRFIVYSDIYYPNITASERDSMNEHLDHCIEALRSTLMCYGNTALLSYFWEDPLTLQTAPRSNSQAVCAKWSSIEDWARSRMVAANPEYVQPPVTDRNVD